MICLEEIKVPEVTFRARLCVSEETRWLCIFRKHSKPVHPWLAFYVSQLVSIANFYNDKNTFF